MSLELLYTSAPKGLKQGSRGFCTVLSTAGMPVNLANRLESLSGYRLIYQPNDPKAKLNPVALSHMKLAVAGKTVSILSRVTAFGSDYSGRTNKIAHHVVLDPKEHTSNGPSDQLLHGNILKSTWDGVCSSPATGPRIADRRVEAGVCVRWQGLGDSGWAGVIADAWLKPNSRICWIIFDEKQSQLALELIQEAVLLLPEQQRWNATFSTYFSSQPPDVDCRVRFVLAESEEARMAQARGIVIDITKPLGKATDTPSVLLARLGKSIVSERRDPIEQVPKLDAQLDLPFRPGTVTPERPLASTTASGSVGYEDSSIELQLAKLEPEKKQAKQPKPLALPPTLPGVKGKNGATPPAMPSFQKPSSMPWIIAAAAVACLLFLLVCGIVVVQQIEQRKLLAEANAKKLEEEKTKQQSQLKEKSDQEAEAAKRKVEADAKEKADQDAQESKIKSDLAEEEKRKEASERLAALHSMKDRPIEFEVGGAPPSVLKELTKILSDDPRVQISEKPSWLKFEDGEFDGSPELADMNKAESAKIRITGPGSNDPVEIKCKVFNRISKGKDILPIRLEISEKTVNGNLFSKIFNDGVPEGFEVKHITEVRGASIRLAEKTSLLNDRKKPFGSIEFRRDGSFNLLLQSPLVPESKYHGKFELQFESKSIPERVFVTSLDIVCKGGTRKNASAKISIDKLIADGLSEIVDVQTDYMVQESDLNRGVKFNLDGFAESTLSEKNEVVFEKQISKIEKETFRLSLPSSGKKLTFAIRSTRAEVFRGSAFAALVNDQRDTGIANKWLEEFAIARKNFVIVNPKQQYLIPQLGMSDNQGTFKRTNWEFVLKKATNRTRIHGSDPPYSKSLFLLLMDSIRMDFILESLKQRDELAEKMQKDPISPEKREEQLRQLEELMGQKWLTSQGGSVKDVSFQKRREDLENDRQLLKRMDVHFNSYQPSLENMLNLIQRFEEAKFKFSVPQLLIDYGTDNPERPEIMLDFELSLSVDDALLAAIQKYQNAIRAIK